MRFGDQFTDVAVLEDEYVSSPSFRGAGQGLGEGQRSLGRSAEVKAVRSGSVGLDRALTIREAAQVLGVSYATTRRLLMEGKISYQRVSPRRSVIQESVLLAYLKGTTAEASVPLKNSLQREVMSDRCHQGCDCRRPN